MERRFYILCIIIFTSHSPISSMEHYTLDQSTPQISILTLSKALVAHIAHYCEPYEENMLTATCKRLYKYRVLTQINSSDLHLTNHIGNLFTYTQSGNKDMVQFLLRAGLNPNYKNILGLAPLHYAIEKNHINIVKLLIKHGARINQPRTYTYPLHEAVYKNDKDLILMLLQSQADPNCTLANGIAPLHIAVQNNTLEIVTFLLYFGADINQKTNDGWTPLCIAAHNNHIDIIRSLLSFKAKVNPKATSRRTPLYVASHYGHIEAIKALIDAGANLNQGNKKGWTPLCTASCNGHIEVVKLLLDAGAHIDQALQNGNTPLQIAQKMGHLLIVKLLQKQLERDIMMQNQKKKKTKKRDFLSFI